MLEEIVVEKVIETPGEIPAPTLEEKDKEVTEAIKRKEEHLANIEKALAEANIQLRTTRKAVKANPPQEEEIPEIDEDEPSAKAWTKRINDSVSPVQAELEADKAEVREFALRSFLEDKPALAKNPERIKQLISTYEKLRTSSGRTSEGVLLDLNKAYVADHAEELLSAVRGNRVNSAKALELESDIAVSRGASTYQPAKPPKHILSADDKLQLAKWGMSEDEWRASKEKYSE